MYAAPTTTTTTTTTIVVPPATDNGPIRNFAGVAANAAKQVRNAYDSRPAVTKYVVHTEEGVSPEVREYVSQNLKSVFDALDPLFGRKGYDIVLTATADGTRRIATSLDPANTEFIEDVNRTLNAGRGFGTKVPPCNGLSGFGIGYTTRPVIVIDGGTGCNWLGDPNYDNSSATVGMVSFYVAQTEASRQPNIRCVAPVWFLQGQAELVGVSLGVMNGQSRTTETRRNLLSWMTEPKGKRVLSAHEDYTATAMEYPYGLLALEYLVARFGWDASMNVIRVAGNAVAECPDSAGATQAFATAVQKVYGISLATLYDDTDAYIDWAYRNRNN